MPRSLILTAAALLAACATPASHAQQPPVAPAAAPQAVRPLANLAAQRIVVTPVYALERTDPLGWAAALARPRVTLRALDSAIVEEFDARGLGRTWYFPPALRKEYELNSTYATDPYALAEAPLRDKIEVGKYYGDPLATQLRTMVAMQDGARYVLLPVELRFEKAAAGPLGVAVLKLVLVDTRLTEFRWVYEVRSDPAPAFGPPVLASLASHFADLVVAP
ncbi:MAG: hypothetical protein KGJ70_00595 [Gemmatimonadota bacterium]|nr:hypothetical protein [Gemmatimonadota bacterium]